LSNHYIDKINNLQSDPFLASLRLYAKGQEVPIMTDEGIRFLNQMIRISNAKRIVEIGTAIGYSAIAMAQANPDITIITIEREPDMIQIARDNITNSGFENRITSLEGDALDIDETQFGTIDLLFIDGAKAQSAKFFLKYESILKPGGLIITDNLLFHGLVYADKTGLSRNVIRLVEKIDDFNQFVVNHPCFDTQIYDVGDGMSLSIKKE